MTCPAPAVKRQAMAARVVLLGEKREALLAAAKAWSTEQNDHWRALAERTLEVRAIEYAVAVQRYLGGRNP